VLLTILNFNQMNFNKYILSGLVMLTLASCEDVIEVDVDAGEVQLAVDAFINNKAEVQKVILLETKPFFSDDGQKAYSADSVYIIDDLNNKYVFEDLDGDGTYEWDDTVLVHVGRTYNLTIKIGADEYVSTSTASAVATIDSINWEYIPAGLGADNGGYAAELVSRDLVGQVDYYQIKWAKNGEFVTGLESITLSVDGVFSEAGAVDGGLFIAPISTFPAIDTEDSLGIGDTFTYELLRIEESTFNFWNEVLNQRVNGALGALFATPTSNVKSNIIPTGSSSVAVGWFSASMVDSHSQVIYDKPGEHLSFKIND
jgi:hypothetical protein